PPPSESDAFIDKPREEIAVDNEAAPFCFVVSRGFCGNDFLKRLTFPFECTYVVPHRDQHVAELDQLRLVTYWPVPRNHDGLVRHLRDICPGRANHSVNAPAG